MLELLEASSSWLCLAFLPEGMELLVVAGFLSHPLWSDRHGAIEIWSSILVRDSGMEALALTSILSFLFFWTNNLVHSMAHI